MFSYASNAFYKLTVTPHISSVGLEEKLAFLNHSYSKRLNIQQCKICINIYAKREKHNTKHEFSSNPVSPQHMVT